MATFQTDPVFLATLARAAKIPDPKSDSGVIETIPSQKRSECLEKLHLLGPNIFGIGHMSQPDDVSACCVTSRHIS